MKIITLLENNSSKKELKSSHGLSLYIEVGNKKILFDIGSNNNYKKNAKILGIDLNEVDTLKIGRASCRERVFRTV